MTALQVLAEFRELGGWLIPAGERLLWQSPVEPPPRLIEGLRERKADLLKLLQKPDGPCPECGVPYYWQDSAGQWHCGTCSPDPRAARMKGVSLQLLGDRPISTTPPTSDLPQPGSWARTAAGAVCELVLFEASGSEVLMRGLRSGQLRWFDPLELCWETAWPWNDAAPTPQRQPAPDRAGTLCTTCRALRWGPGGSRCDCTHPPVGGHAASCPCPRCRRTQ
jgi:hypothetical protein